MFGINCTRINQSQPRNISLYIIRIVCELLKRYFLNFLYIWNHSSFKHVKLIFKKSVNNLYASVFTVIRETTVVEILYNEMVLT